MMKAFITGLVAVGVTACGSTPPSSLGDSSIHEIRCPSILEYDACLQRAERQCGSDQYKVLGQPPEPENIAEGRTVPIEGTIRHYIITIRCEDDV